MVSRVSRELGYPTPQTSYRDIEAILGTGLGLGLMSPGAALSGTGTGQRREAVSLCPSISAEGPDARLSLP